MKNDRKEEYMLLRDAYTGAGGFLDGSRLMRHFRESVEKYEQRRRIAYYLNYLKPCVDAHVTPIFKALAIRDYEGTGSAVWEVFMNDVDFTGTHIKDLMRRAAIESKLNGVAFIVMDMPDNIENEISTIYSLSKDRNKLPYAFVVSPVQVDEIGLDKFGRITKFVYKEPDQYSEQQFATRTLTPEGWSLKDSKGEKSGTWNLGVVPVVPLFSKEHDNFDALPPSDFISIAKTNLAIYNMSSWLSDILVNQTFSILVYPSNDQGDLTIGTSNALGYPSDATHEPKFIAPAADPANVLIGQIASLQQEIYRMTVVVNVTGSNRQQSGYAKAWDYEATNQLLSDFADAVESAELKVARLFCLWTGTELDYKVNYPNDFKISEVEQELANAEIAKGLNFGDGFNVEVFKRVLTAYLPELMAEDFDRLVADYMAMQEQERLDLNNEDVDDDDGANNTEDNNED